MPGVSFVSGSWDHLQALQREEESKEETSLQPRRSVCETALKDELQRRVGRLLENSNTLDIMQSVQPSSTQEFSAFHWTVFSSLALKYVFNHSCSTDLKPTHTHPPSPEEKGNKNNITSSHVKIFLSLLCYCEILSPLEPSLCLFCFLIRNPCTARLIC